MSGFKERKGFTLVDLIVVIAIVTILASISIIGYTRFIENSKMSNDNQLATQMTNLIKYDSIGQASVPFHAHDVRTIITENGGDDIGLTPQSRNTAFVEFADDRLFVLSESMTSRTMSISRFIPQRSFFSPTKSLTVPMRQACFLS